MKKPSPDLKNQIPNYSVKASSLQTEPWLNSINQALICTCNCWERQGRDDRERAGRRDVRVARGERGERCGMEVSWEMREMWELRDERGRGSWVSKKNGRLTEKWSPASLLSENSPANSKSKWVLSENSQAIEYFIICFLINKYFNN